MSRKLTQEEFEDRVNSYHGDEYIIVGEYHGMYSPIEIIHQKCGNQFTVKRAMDLCGTSKPKCERCESSKYVDYLYPWLLQNMKNPDDAKDYPSSKKEVVVVCPCCKKEYKTKLVNYVKSQRVQCPTCKDGFSYPERLMSNVLRSLGLDFNYQFVTHWTNGYRYDFEISANKLIIEMDGALGHNNGNTLSGMGKEESIMIDQIKNKIAISNGYTIVRIDCNYRNYNKQNFLQKQIVDSLSKYYDFSNIDWVQCHINSISSLVDSVINTYLFKTEFVDEIADITKVKARTVIKYIKDAMNCGIIPVRTLYRTNYLRDYPDSMICLTDRHPRDRPIYCKDDGLLFKSITDAAIYYGIKPSALLFAMTQNKHRCYKGKNFEYY